MRGKIKKIIFTVLTVFLLTGCSSNDNDNPEKVALAMMDILVSGNYSDAEELLYLEDGMFFSETGFENFLSDQGILSINLDDYEITDSDIETGETSKLVSIQISGTQYLKIQTVYVDGKWYVDLGDDIYDENLTIEVPHSSIVKINGVVLNYEDYATTEEVIGTPSYGSGITVTATKDVYVIDKIFEGEYTLTVECEGADDYETTIYSSISYYNAYMYDSEDYYFYYSTDRYNVFLFTDDDSGQSIDNFVESYFEDLLTSLNNDDDFSSIASYFDDDYLDEAKASYDEMIEDKEYTIITLVTTYSDYSLNSISYYDVWHHILYDDDTYIAYVDYSVKYHYYKASDYSGVKNDEYLTEEFQTVLEITDLNGTYKISGESNAFPSIG